MVQVKHHPTALLVVLFSVMVYEVGEVKSHPLTICCPFFLVGDDAVVKVICHPITYLFILSQVVEATDEIYISPTYVFLSTSSMVNGEAQVKKSSSFIKAFHFLW